MLILLFYWFFLMSDQGCFIAIASLQGAVFKGCWHMPIFCRIIKPVASGYLNKTI